MKNIRVKVTENCTGTHWWFGIYDGRKELMTRSLSFNHGCSCWQSKDVAIRNAKAMAKKLIIKYDPKIIKRHGC